MPELFTNRIPHYCPPGAIKRIILCFLAFQQISLLHSSVRNLGIFDGNLRLPLNQENAHYVPLHMTLCFLTRTIVTLFLEFFTIPFYNSLLPLKLSHCFFNCLFNVFLYLNIKICMYLIDHVAELRFVNRLIYVIKRIYTVIRSKIETTSSPSYLTPATCAHSLPLSTALNT